MAFSAKNTAILSRINRSNVEQTLATTRRFLTSERWLALQNRYTRDVVGEIKRNIGPPPTQNARHLSQYISASSLLHCSDGWSFLGRSVNALLSGDEGTALHLAYYAELRAAMSLLATQGVGVFNNQHYLIDRPNSTVAFPSGTGTHVFVWECLEAWANTSHASDLLGEVIAPYGLTLSGWTSPVGSAPVIRLSGQHWLKEWGMDLSNFEDDRNARNTASYRPVGLELPKFGKAEEATSFVRSLWTAMRPEGALGFGQLDKFLFRDLVERIVIGRHGMAALGSGDHQQLVNRMIAFQGGVISSRSNEIRDFLLRGTAVDDPEVLRFSPQPPNIGVHGHLSVISRAALLLRLSTGATRKLFSEAGVQSSETAFWRDNLGERKGLWKSGSMPDPLTDLWADVDEGLRDFEDFEADTPDNRNHFDLFRTFSASVSELGKFERISILNL